MDQHDLSEISKRSGTVVCFEDSCSCIFNTKYSGCLGVCLAVSPKHDLVEVYIYIYIYT